jgi:hypothetical protein
MGDLWWGRETGPYSCITGPWLVSPEQAAHYHILLHNMRLRVLTTAILIGEVGEPPDISDADRESDAGQQELPAGTPVSAFRHRSQRGSPDSSVYPAVQHWLAARHDVRRETSRWTITRAVPFPLPQGTSPGGRHGISCKESWIPVKNGPSLGEQTLTLPLQTEHLSCDSIYVVSGSSDWRLLKKHSAPWT